MATLQDMTMQELLEAREEVDYERKMFWRLRLQNDSLLEAMNDWAQKVQDEIMLRRNRNAAVESNAPAETSAPARTVASGSNS